MNEIRWNQHGEIPGEAGDGLIRCYVCRDALTRQQAHEGLSGNPIRERIDTDPSGVIHD
jgi:hypothetical protein